MNTKEDTLELVLAQPVSRGAGDSVVGKQAGVEEWLHSPEQE